MQAFSSKLSRRTFLKQNSLAGLGVALASSPVAGLPAIASKSAQVPAILGGPSAWAEVKWPIWPQWNPETDEKLLLEVVRSGIWSRADVVTRFEKEWAAALGVKRCLAVVNGTNALVTAIHQLGIGAGDEVLVPPYTFIASVSSILSNGAMPVFVESTVLELPRLWINGGRGGFLVGIEPAVLSTPLGAKPVQCALAE